MCFNTDQRGFGGLNQSPRLPQKNAADPNGSTQFSQEQPEAAPLPVQQQKAPTSEGPVPVKAKTSIASKFETQPTQPVTRPRQQAAEGAVAPGRVFGREPVRVMR